jgi:hypothetical protein
MERDEITIRDLGARIAAVFGYPSGGADALRFYLLHKGGLPARTVLAMRPHELLAAYDSLDTAAAGSELLH